MQQSNQTYPKSDVGKSKDFLRRYATPAEIRAMQKSADEVRRRAEKYPNCKHPKNRVRPLVPGHSMLWCSLCWEAWEPITLSSVTIANQTTVRIV